MSIKKLFGTDNNLEKNGVLLDYGDFSILIARAGGSNQKYNKVLERKSKPHQRAIANDTFDSELASKILMETYAETVVLGWTGVMVSDLGETEASGDEPVGEDQPLAFSKANAILLFEAYPDLYLDIQQQATKMTLFRNEMVGDAAKNS